MSMGKRIAVEAAIEDHFHPVEDLRRRLIAFKTLSLWLQALTVLTVIVLIGSGVLLATSHLLTPNVATAKTTNGQVIQIPLVVYFTTIGAMSLGWSFVIVASLRIHVAVRLGLCFLAAGILGAGPILQLYAFATAATAATVATSPTGLDGHMALPAAQALILVVLVLSIVAMTVVGACSRKGAQHRLAYDVWVCGLVGLYFVADALTVTVYDLVANPGRFIPSSLATQASLLPGILAVVVYWGSTDFIEWGETSASHVAALISRRTSAWFLVMVMAVVAGVFTVDTFRRLSILALLPSFPAAIVILVLVVFLVRQARVDAEWPQDVPVGALIAGAMFLFLFVQISLDVVTWISTAIHLPSSSINPFYTILSISQAVALLAISIFLIWRARRTSRRQMAATGVFLGMMAVLVIALSLPQLANVFGLPVIRESQPNVADFKIIASVGLISMAMWLAIRKRLTANTLRPFIAAFMLVVGLQVIGWYFQLFVPSLHALSSQSVLVAAVLFIGAILWDVVTSGAQVTNRETQAFPRSARVLLYLGYALFACATFLYATSQVVAATGLPAPVPSSGIPLEVVGAEGLGLPLLVWNFARRIKKQGGQ